MDKNSPSEKQLQIRIDDDTLKGNYANAMQVTHTKEEFVLDFMNMFPPQGIVTTRVITSPGHLKRIIAALSENMDKYEQQFGKIKAAEDPQLSSTPN